MESTALAVSKVWLSMDSLRSGNSALLLLDPLGVCVGGWGSRPGIIEELEAMNAKPGYDVGAWALGLDGVASLADRRSPAMRQCESTPELLRPFRIEATPLVDGLTGRSLGSLLAVGGDSETLEWMERLTSQVATELKNRARHSEQVLMEHFLEERRDSRHAVVALNDHVIITNAPAARTVGVEEQARLWEHARRMIGSSVDSSDTLELGRGRTLRVTCERVIDNNITIGVIMRWRRPSQPPLATVSGEGLLSDLAGGGARWRSMKRRLAAAGSTSTLLAGEPGTGRATIARSIMKGCPIHEIDLADFAGEGVTAMAKQLRRASNNGEQVLLRHLEVIDPEESDQLARVIQDLASSVRLFGTMDIQHSNSVARASLLDSFGALVTVPPLRERTEDVPELVRALTTAHLRRSPGLGGVQWMTDALQALTRLEWPKNVSSLAALVAQVVPQVGSGYVTARDLPAGIAVRASGRNLSALERVEARLILQALKDSNGNKSIAADSLGMARSTLYRKLRWFAIDLSSSTY